MLKIFGRVLLDLVLFQEAIELVTRTDAEKRAELVAGDAPLAVGFEAAGFESRAGKVPAGLCERGGQIVGNFEGDLHCDLQNRMP